MRPLSKRMQRYARSIYFTKCFSKKLITFFCFIFGVHLNTTGSMHLPAPSIAFILFLLVQLACTNPAPSVSSTLTTDTLEPEDVLILWQSYIDQDQYDSARLISTGKVFPFIAFLESITFNTDSTESVSLTLLRNLECDIRGDSAVCRYMTKDEIGQDVPDTVLMRRINGRWLVDRVFSNGETPSDSLLQGKEMPFPGETEDEEFQ
jgi:hypothetical protein